MLVQYPDSNTPHLSLLPFTLNGEKLTESMLSPSLRYRKHESRITGITPSTAALASSEGAARSDIIEGGSSWWMSFAARDSQTALTFRCMALQVIWRRGPGGREMLDPAKEGVTGSMEE